jgi:hypothetical protein
MLSRARLGVDKDAPEPPRAQAAQAGRIVAIPQVGGLHHLLARRSESNSECDSENRRKMVGGILTPCREELDIPVVQDRPVSWSLAFARWCVRCAEN